MLQFPPVSLDSHAFVANYHLDLAGQQRWHRQAFQMDQMSLLIGSFRYGHSSGASRSSCEYRRRRQAG